nr:SusE domain-containing protein [uncultured Flavobacterium sp.]
MKNIFKLGIFAMLVMSTGACNSDDITVVTPSTAAVLAAPAEGTTFVFDKAKATEVAATFKWEAAKYTGAVVAVEYEIEMAKSGTDFKNAAVVAVTTDITKALTGGELNAAAMNCGLTPFIPQDADIRIKSYLGEGGIVQYSNVIKINVTAYSAWDNWGLIGSATPNGWNDPDTNLDYDLATKKYSYTGPLVVGEYKFRIDDKWDTNFGDDGNDLSLEPGGANIPITVAGNYTLVVDFAAKKYTITKN